MLTTVAINSALGTSTTAIPDPAAGSVRVGKLGSCIIGTAPLPAIPSAIQKRSRALSTTLLRDLPRKAQRPTQQRMSHTCC